MTNYESTFELLKSQLKPRIRDLLTAEGITISHNGMFKCINPQHNDSNASMKLLSDLNEEQVWCYGCSSTGDIFTVNHWLNKSPLSGIEFIQRNVLQLADRFGIPHNDFTISPEQAEKLEWYRLNTIISDKLILRDERGEPRNWTAKHCEERGWNPRTCEKLYISTILDYNKLLRDVQRETGMTLEALQEKGLTSDLFGPDLITITLFDERGRAVGFTARNLKFDPKNKKEGPQKYKNSSHSVIFQKGKILYGMNLVRNAKHRRLDIFEGNGSFIVAFGAGHNSCVSLCGSSITEEQVKLIIDMGFHHINFVLDNDETGRTKTDEMMQRLSGIEGLRVECTKLEFKEEHQDLKDPEDFIKKYSLASFFKLKPKGAFDWYIEKESSAIALGTINVTDFCNKMVRVIFNTSNRIERARQRSKLAGIVGVPEADIEAEIQRIERSSVLDIKSLLSKKISQAKSADDISNAIEEAKSSLGDSLEAKSNTQVLSVQESLDSLDSFITVLENKRPGLQGWTSGFDILDLKLSGIPKPVGHGPGDEIIPIAGTLIGFPGAPQHAKSTIMQNIALNIAMKNDDVTVLYWALDDARHRLVEKFLSIMSGIKWTRITRRETISEQEKSELKGHIDKLKELTASGRLLMKDHSNGSSLPVLFRWTEMMQQQFGRPILVVIDSFHKIHASGGLDHSSNNTYSQTKSFSEKIKSFAQTHHASIMASIEMNKGQQRGYEPDLMNMTEARKMEYDFDILATVYNHYYDMDGDSQQKLVRIDMNGREKILPLIKVNIRKSKDGGSGPIYFSLDLDNFRIKNYSMEEIATLTMTTTVKNVNLEGLKFSTPDVGNLIQDPNKYLEPWSR